MTTYPQYPESEAVKVWTIEDMTFSIVKQPFGHYCGYVRFPERFVEENDYHGILTYVPVHGGITFARMFGNDMVYGFDCAHADDENDPDLRNIDWLTDECERMAWAIIVAYYYEGVYLEAQSGEERAAVLDLYHDEMRGKGVFFHLDDNFGAMIETLFGDWS